MARLREEVQFYQLEGLMQQLQPYYNAKYPPKNGINGLTGSTMALNSLSTSNPIFESGKTFLKL